MASDGPEDGTPAWAKGTAADRTKENTSAWANGMAAGGGLVGRFRRGLADTDWVAGYWLSMRLVGVVIYHIAFAEDWAQARRVGEYAISTRGRTLAEQGFIHASDAHQVATVANSFYATDDGLIVLTIDTERLRSPVRYEDAPGTNEKFPHIYGPVNVDAVIGTAPLERGPDGQFDFIPA